MRPRTRSPCAVVRPAHRSGSGRPSCRDPAPGPAREQSARASASGRVILWTRPLASGDRPRRTSGLRVCLFCGLALITDERPSFEWKESNRCSSYEATIWKSFGRLLFFFFAERKLCTFSYKPFALGDIFSAFIFFFLNPPSACHSKITSIAVHHLARLLLPAIKPGMRTRLFVFHVPASLPLFDSVLFLLLVNQILKKKPSKLISKALKASIPHPGAQCNSGAEDFVSVYGSHLTYFLDCVLPQPLFYCCYYHLFVF